MSKAGRNHTVDFLKGICVLFVIITHCVWSDKERLAFLFPFWIDMAVPLFMVLSGYVHAKSLLKKGVQHLDNCYTLRGVASKIIRFVLPFVLPFAIAQWAFFALDNHPFGWRTLLNAFLNGGNGPGAYYVPVMIQFVFLFPVIFFVVKRFAWKGVLLCGIANFVFELVKGSWYIDAACYRVLVFRYIFVIAFGCFLAMGDIPKKPWLPLGMFVMGVGYILVFRYGGWKPMVTDLWTGTSMFACLFLLPVAAKLIACQRLKNPIVELFGRASYNIFLVQMTFFTLSRPVFAVIESRILQVVLAVVTCVIVGILYYFAETPITAFVIKKICTFGKTNKEVNVTAK